MEKIFSIENAKALLGKNKCGNDLNCVKYGLEKVCQAKDVGLRSYLVCLEKHRTCGLSINYGGGVYCKCPVRVHIKQEFSK